MSHVVLPTTSGDVAMHCSEFEKILNDGKVLRKLFYGSVGGSSPASPSGILNRMVLQKYGVDRDIFLLIKAIIIHNKIPSDPTDIASISSSRFREQCESIGGFTTIDELCLDYFFTPNVPMTPQTNFRDEYLFKLIVVTNNQFSLQSQIEKTEKKGFVYVGGNTQYLYMRKKRSLDTEEEENDTKKKRRTSA